MAKTTLIMRLALMSGLALGGFLPSAASGCGTFDRWLAQPVNDGVQLERVLRNLDCVAFTDYHADKHGERLFNVILEAVRSRRGLESAQRLFEKYACLPEMRKRPEYGEVLEAFGEDRCTPEGFFGAKPDQLLVVSVSGARIRKEPSVAADIIDGAPRGNIVKRLGKEGSWFRIKTRWGNVGYMHASCLRERIEAKDNEQR